VNRRREIGKAGIMGISFSGIQYIEYKMGKSSIMNRSGFYAATGLHGIHMIIGEIIIVVT
jgi:heme/copper-type cytochrome/quinol oxidase subunit 3